MWATMERLKWRYESDVTRPIAVSSSSAASQAFRAPSESPTELRRFPSRIRRSARSADLLEKRPGLEARGSEDPGPRQRPFRGRQAPRRRPRLLAEVGLGQVGARVLGRRAAGRTDGRQLGFRLRHSAGHLERADQREAGVQRLRHRCQNLPPGRDRPDPVAGDGPVVGLDLEPVGAREAARELERRDGRLLGLALAAERVGGPGEGPVGRRQAGCPRDRPLQEGDRLVPAVGPELEEALRVEAQRLGRRRDRIADRGRFLVRAVPQAQADPESGVHLGDQVEELLLRSRAADGRHGRPGGRLLDVGVHAQGAFRRGKDDVRADDDEVRSGEAPDPPEGLRREGVGTGDPEVAQKAAHVLAGDGAQPTPGGQVGRDHLGQGRADPGRVGPASRVVEPQDRDPGARLVPPLQPRPHGAAGAELESRESDQGKCCRRRQERQGPEDRLARHGGRRGLRRGSRGPIQPRPARPVAPWVWDDRREEPVAPPTDRLDDRRGLVLCAGLPDRADGPVEVPFLHDGVRPDRLDHLLPGNEAPRVPDQVEQGEERLLRQDDPLPGRLQRRLPVVQDEGAEPVPHRRTRILPSPGPGRPSGERTAPWRPLKTYSRLLTGSSGGPAAYCEPF